MTVNPDIEIQLKTLPDSPGVYQYYDKDDKLLYVGKAKNLKKRVTSYFTKQHDSARLNVLVRKIASIKHTVVETEMDALLLENSMIKNLNPRYNILLKDDKTYPWICIKNERFPRIFSTRQMIKDGSEYFGPYTSGKVLHTVLQLIKELYPLRTCAYDLSPSNIRNDKYKVCLEFHIGNCLGPCEGLESEEEYMRKIQGIRSILKGDFKDTIKFFKDLMMQHAQKMEFEEAQKIKDKLITLENYQAKSTVVNPKISDVEVYSIVSDEVSAYINMLQINKGTIVRSHTIELKKKLDESDEELLTLAIVELRERFQSFTRELIVPFEIS